MPVRRRPLAAVAVLWAATSACCPPAADAADAKHAPCATAAHRQFDFWLGAWNLVVPSGIAGPNDVTRDGCVLLEHFREATGTVGRSVTFYRERDGTWYQAYVDSRGNRIDLRGGLEGSRIVMRAAGGAGALWEPLDADNVRFQQFDASGRTTFDSTYVRR